MAEQSIALIMSWEEDLKLNRITRQRFLDLLDGYGIEDICRIPKGFNNSMLWNFGHAIVTRQLLIYGLSGLPLALDDELLAAYRKGSKPSEIHNGQSDYIRLKSVAMDLLDQFEQGMREARFVQFSPYVTSYGFELNKLTDAIRFNNLHESLHLGYAMAQRKLL